eukprot:8491245-Alexandrium_andersonii.AAC.1
MLKSLAEAGIWVDQDLNLRAEGEQPCPLLGAAAQGLRLWLVTCYHRAAVARLAGRREKEFGGLEEVEVRTLRAYAQKCCPRDRQLLHKITAGAVWTAARKQQAA